MKRKLPEMRNSLRALLFIVALLFSQHAAMLHGLAHGEHDIALASHDGKAPKLDHETDICAAFGALGHALGKTSVMHDALARVEPRAQAPAFQVFSVAPRIAFDSRAPPLST